LTPTVILAAECDYIPWDVILQYKEALLNEKVFYFEDAGHMIHLTQPSLMADIIRSFLLETEFPVAPYTSSANPRPFVSP
jgi:proline iminopeptidase